MKGYAEFLESKGERSRSCGFEPLWLPDCLFPFQRHLTDWSIRQGRAALFEDCGLGKSLQELVWARNLVEKTNRPVLLLCPLAVSYQMVDEGKKFGIECKRSKAGEIKSKIVVTNYQRLHHFDPVDFVGVICDESSILKQMDGKMRRQITDFLSKVEYRLLATATPAPNDFMELGTSSEALGAMPYHQMLGMFFVNDGKSTQQWNLKGHAKRRFWRWMAGWSRAIRKPSDLDFDDDGFILPELKMVQHMIKSPPPKMGLFPVRAVTLEAQRTERRRTLDERCEKVAEVVPKDRPCVVWCHLNAEGDLLERLIPDAVQVAGKDSDDDKEERLTAFRRGHIRVIVSKPKIAGFGQNWQHCSDVTFFPSHSYEQYYQAVRRCWRFGQQRPVTVHLVTSEAESLVLENMQRKERQAIEMFSGIVREMRDYQLGKRGNGKPTEGLEVPEWLR